jgi:protein-tyrosine-phosphatase
MAEALARKYGSDCIVASSAGLSPALQTHAMTRAVLREKNVELGDHMPRNLADLKPKNYDLLVNMSGAKLPANMGVPVETWVVPDPFGRSDEAFRTCRDDIEMRVMQLILRIRTGKFDKAIDSQAASSRQ